MFGVIMLTALDQVANQNHLQLFKAIVPYLQPTQQKTFSLVIKMMEMQNVMQFFQRDQCVVSACSAASEETSMLDILNDIRSYCEENEQKMIDQWIQIISAMELYSIFAQSPPTADEQMNRGEPYE
jgi:hypothetical protein